MRTEQIRFQQTLAPLQGIRVRDFAPLSGKIIHVTFHFPAGCNALVDVAFGHGGRQVLPSDTGFIALNDATPVWTVDEDVTINSSLWCIMQNTDALNPHTISVIATMVGE